MNLRPPPQTGTLEELQEWSDELYEFLKFPVFPGGANFGDTTNYAAIANDGDIIFHGTGGLAFGEIYAHGVTTGLTSETVNDWDQILAFDTDGKSNNTTPAHGQDHITIISPGIYYAFFHWCGYGPAAAHDWGFHVSKNNNFAQFNNVTAHATTPAAQNDMSVSAPGLIDLAAGDTIELWVIRTSAGNDIVLTTRHCGLSLIQVAGT